MRATKIVHHNGTFIRPADRCINEIIDLLDLSSAHSVGSPSADVPMDESSPLLSAELRKTYASCVGKALYLSKYRPDVQRE
eukprot:14252214-Alexandrium_andersonii.AAC.1